MWVGATKSQPTDPLVYHFMLAAVLVSVLVVKRCHDQGNLQKKTFYWRSVSLPASEGVSIIIMAGWGVGGRQVLE